MKVIDKIRAMSTEEVAQKLYKFNEFGDMSEEFSSFCCGKLVEDEYGDLTCPHDYDRCRECIKEWLESEVEER